MTPDVTNTNMAKPQTANQLAKNNNAEGLEIEGDFDEDDEEGEDAKPNQQDKDPYALADKQGQPSNPVLSAKQQPNRLNS